METAFIVTENEFKKWVKEAVKEYFHEFSLKPSGVSKKKNACYIKRKLHSFYEFHSDINRLDEKGIAITSSKRQSLF